MASSAVEESTTTARKRPCSSTVAEIEAPPANVYLELEATKGAAAAMAARLKAFADRVHDLDPGFVVGLRTDLTWPLRVVITTPRIVPGGGSCRERV